MLIAFPLFTKLNTYVAWKYQQEYIAKYLCINKDKKELKCKGKCQLMKQLKDEPTSTDKPLPQIPKEIQFQPYVAYECNELSLNNFQSKNTQSPIFYWSIFNPRDYLSSIFVPPDQAI